MKQVALLYHDVVPNQRFDLSGFQGAGPNVYKLDPAEFRRHLEAIARATAVGAQPLLTFDDGGSSAFSPVAGMLEEFGWRGHFLVTTDRIGTRGFLNESQLIELHKRGHVIGSHSRSHPPRISACTVDELNCEWGESVLTLERLLGEPVTTASIPGGYYSRRVAVAAAARAGIRLLFTSEPVRSTHVMEGCTLAGRFVIQQGVSASWVGSVVAGEIRPRLQRYLFWNGKKILKGMVGSGWLSLRRRILTWKAHGGVRSSR